MSKATNLIEALTPLAWPVVALVLFLVFKKDVRALLSRIRRGKVLGQEFDFDQELDSLNASANQAEEEPAAGSPVAPAKPPEPEARLDERREIGEEAAPDARWT